MEKKKRRRGDRRDGALVRDLDLLHEFLPHIYLNRTDCEAFMQIQVEVAPMLAYLEQKNAQINGPKYTMFHIIAAAVAKTVHLRPILNRFIAGRRVYQRDEISLSFVAKKAFKDDAHEGLMFVSLGRPDSVIDEVHKKITGVVKETREHDRMDNNQSVMKLVLGLPRPLLYLVAHILRRLDYYGRVPYDIVKGDPNYASIFLANLGSIGLNAGYHHLTNWGTNSLFVVIGKRHYAPFYTAAGTEMREVLDLGITLDERLGDGYYYAKSIKLIEHLIQNPQLLEKPMTEALEYE